MVQISTDLCKVLFAYCFWSWHILPCHPVKNTCRSWEIEISRRRITVEDEFRERPERKMRYNNWTNDIIGSVMFLSQSKTSVSLCSLLRKLD